MTCWEQLCEFSSYFLPVRSDYLGRFTDMSGLLFFLNSVIFHLSHSSLCLPRDCLSCGGKWKHKQAESALWFLLLLTLSPSYFPYFASSLSHSFLQFSLFCWPCSFLYCLLNTFYYHHLLFSPLLHLLPPKPQAWCVLTKCHHWPQVVNRHNCSPTPANALKMILKVLQRIETYDSDASFYFFLFFSNCDSFFLSQNALAQVQLWRWIWR